MPKGIPRDQSTQRAILHRLKIARGHMDKVIKMVEDNEYCIDVVHQSRALQAALKKADHILLENHLRECVTDGTHHGMGEEMMDEIIEIVKRS